MKPVKTKFNILFEEIMQRRTNSSGQAWRWQKDTQTGEVHCQFQTDGTGSAVRVKALVPGRGGPTFCMLDADDQIIMEYTQKQFMMSYWDLYSKFKKELAAYRRGQQQFFNPPKPKKNLDEDSEDPEAEADDRQGRDMRPIEIKSFDWYLDRALEDQQGVRIRVQPYQFIFRQDEDYSVKNVFEIEFEYSGENSSKIVVVCRMKPKFQIFNVQSYRLDQDTDQQPEKTYTESEFYNTFADVKPSLLKAVQIYKGKYLDIA